MIKLRLVLLATLGAFLSNACGDSDGGADTTFDGGAGGAPEQDAGSQGDADSTADGSVDYCEENGWYGDGQCDDSCPLKDPDCTGECTDPEAETEGSYVSIGTMPAPYPVDWSTPWKAMITSFGTGTAKIPGAAPGDRSHSIGHVLLKVRCEGEEPFYISQTGANVAPIAGISSELWATISQAYMLYVNSAETLWTTHEDGHLYDAAAASADWDEFMDRQSSLDDGTFIAEMDDSTTGDLNLALTVLAGPGSTKEFVRESILDLPPVARHAFVKATLRINASQCAAIQAWRDEYVSTGGASRYSIHRAPWVKRADGSYDGGGCASVGFTGAFYATGLDYKAVGGRAIVRLNIGASRLTEQVIADQLDATAGWFNMQNPEQHFTGTFECRPSENVLYNCYGDTEPWVLSDSSGQEVNPFWQAWSGAEDDEGGDRFSPLASWDGTVSQASAIPMIAFEPEAFYHETLSAWNDPAYDAFTMRGWCTLPGKVPTIVKDARRSNGKENVGRSQGVSGWTEGVRIP